jgi:hypothetical protein
MADGGFSELGLAMASTMLIVFSLLTSLLCTDKLTLQCSVANEGVRESGGISVEGVTLMSFSPKLRDGSFFGESWWNQARSPL